MNQIRDIHQSAHSPTAGLELFDRISVAGTAPAKPRAAMFAGDEYRTVRDHERLTGQIKRVWDCMKDGAWRTLDEIARITGDPQASVSAQLRHLRKPRFGGFEVERRARGDRDHGLFEYRVNTQNTKEES